MKKHLLFLLLLPALAWGGDIEIARMNPYILGSGVSAAAATAYCTGATTCTATTPGDCNIFCEDFEGSGNYCVETSGDQNCRWTYIVSTGTGQSYDATTAHSGTFSLCSDEGSNALTVTSTSAGVSGQLYNLTAFNETDLYGQFYFNVNSITLADTKSQGLFTVYRSGGGAGNLLLILYTSGSDLKLKVSVPGDTSQTSTTTIATNTWYRITFSSKQSDDTTVVKLYDSTGLLETLSFALYNSTTASTGISMGWNGYTLREGTASIQYDNIAISDTALPGTCNP